MMTKSLLLICLVFFAGSLSAAPGKFFLYLKSFKTQTLSEPRDVYVYVPGDYSQSGLKTYPVLYMQDGQNLFDPSRAFLGQTWKAEATLNRLISQGLMAPVIVVAIDNTKLRTFEYTPDQDPGEDQLGGGADDYLNLLTTELKPRIDSTFRTRRERNSTAIMGSSLGGLVSLYAGAAFSQTFGLVGALSPSIWWNQESIINTVLRAPFMPAKVYLDSGDSGGEKPEDVQACAGAFKFRGMVNTVNLKIIIQPGATHSEQFWAERLPLALQFLFPPN
jgi:predicted alpha/beta superfamily hydrolase